MTHWDSNDEAEVINPYAPTSHVSPTEPSDSDVEAYRRKYRNHEESVKSIGFLYGLGAIFLIPLGCSTLVGTIGASMVNNDRQLMIMLGFLWLAFGIFQGVTAFGLRRLKRWSRTTGSVIAGIGLFGFPGGTLLSVYILYVLLCEKGRVVFSDHYQDVIKQTPHVKYKTSFMVWVLLCLLIGIVLIGVATVVIL